MATDEIIETGIQGIVRVPEEEQEPAPKPTPTPSEEEKSDVKMVGEVPADSHIQVTTVPFVAFGRTTRTTNAKLSRLIFTMFRKNFHDLAGVNVLYNGQFNIELYFEHNADTMNDEAEIKNVINISTNNRTMGTFDRMNMISNKSNGINYMLSDATKLLLSDFMYGGRKSNKPNDKKRWSQFIREIHIPNAAPAQMYGFVPQFRGGERVFLAVTGLDPHIVLRHLFGATMVTSSEYDGTGKQVNYTGEAWYELRYMKPNIDGTFSINIEQFDRKAVESYVLEENPQYNQYVGFPMYNV